MEPRQTPQRRVHALLAGFVQDALIENQNHRHKTDKIIARTLFFGKNKKQLAKICAKFLAKKDSFYGLSKTLAAKG